MSVSPCLSLKGHDKILFADIQYIHAAQHTALHTGSPNLLFVLL
jgi:hypothetical protein